jgi:hypothetical protein
MASRFFFYRTPLKDVSDLLAHDTAATLSVFTDSARSVPATVYANNTGTTPKTWPVPVDSEGAFTGYLEPGLTYYTKITGTAIVGSIEAFNEHYPAGASFGSSTIRTGAGVDIAAGKHLIAGLNPWLTESFLATLTSGSSALNSVAQPGFIFSGTTLQLNVPNQMQVHGVGDPPEVRIRKGGHYNQEYPYGGVDGLGATATRLSEGDSPGFISWDGWDSLQYNYKSGMISVTLRQTTGLQAQVGKYYYWPTAYADYEVPPYGVYEDNGAGGYRHATTHIDAPAGTAVKPAIKTGGGYQLDTIGPGADMVFSLGEMSVAHHAREVMRLTAEGRLGLGVDNPFFQFDTDGDMRVRDTAKLYIGGHDPTAPRGVIYEPTSNQMNIEDSDVRINAKDVSTTYPIVRATQSGGAARLGFFGAVTSQQTRGATLINNVTAGGTTDQVDTWTDLTTYATDAAAIRNAVYQVARAIRQHDVAMRAYGLMT